MTTGKCMPWAGWHYIYSNNITYMSRRWSALGWLAKRTLCVFSQYNVVCKPHIRRRNDINSGIEYHWMLYSILPPNLNVLSPGQDIKSLSFNPSVKFFCFVTIISYSYANTQLASGIWFLDIFGFSILVKVCYFWNICCFDVISNDFRGIQAKISTYRTRQDSKSLNSKFTLERLPEPPKGSSS